jgi:hypothetical protein
MLSVLGVTHLLVERHPDAIAFVAPDGFTYEVGVGMARCQPRAGRRGVPQTHFGHVNLHVPDLHACARYFQETLDFRISDLITGRAMFLRCNSEHHAMAYLEGRGVLHHHAWAVPSIRNLAQIADLVDERGSTLLWGPSATARATTSPSTSPNPARRWSRSTPRWSPSWTSQRLRIVYGRTPTCVGGVVGRRSGRANSTALGFRPWRSSRPRAAAEFDPPFADRASRAS